MAAATCPPMSVTEFYAGRSVLITGATGFIGKILMEKLLRECKGMRKVYCLVRPTSKESPEERIKGLLDSEPFDRVRQQEPDFAQRVRAVSGDLAADHMGMSAEDIAELKANVSIVFHVAATIKFNEKIQMAVKLNIVSVRQLLAFSRELADCRAFVHVSTAYAHTMHSNTEEKVYEPTFDVPRFIDFVSQLSPEAADRITPALVGERPNTYTLTKSLAEALVATEGRGLPVSIVRPSIVFASWREPFVGWIDNYNGPSGICLAIGTGVLRTCAGSPAAKSDVVPVDGVANFLIAAAWYVHRQYAEAAGDLPVPVFNYTSTGKCPIAWGDWETQVPKSWALNPLENRVFRLPLLEFVPRESMTFALRRLVRHWIPAYMADAVLMVQGRRPKMVRAYTKLHKAMQGYEFFTTNSWTWDTHNVDKVQAALPESDREKFLFDMAQLHFPTYMTNTLVGIKKYLLREDMDRVNKCRQTQQRMRMLSVLLRVVMLAGLLRLLVPLLRSKRLPQPWLLLAPLRALLGF